MSIIQRSKYLLVITRLDQLSRCGYYGRHRSTLDEQSRLSTQNVGFKSVFSRLVIHTFFGKHPQALSVVWEVISRAKPAENADEFDEFY